MRTAFFFCCLLAFRALAQLPEAPLPPDATFDDSHGHRFTFDQLVDDWIADPRVVVPAKCGGEDCLLVPKYQKSDWCNSDPLSAEPWKNLDWDKCDVPSANRDASHFCVVTDELSQVGLALALRGSASFDPWVKTVRALLPASGPPLPLWNVRVTVGTGNAATIDATPANGDDASDATARIITSLHTAAASPSFSDPQRGAYRTLADQISAAFVNDFVHHPAYGISYWLASGRNTGGRSTPFSPGCTPPDCDPFSYAGYHGDVVIAMLAAYRATGNELYRTLAVDTVKNYLLAAGFTGSFRVPPTRFIWQEENGAAVAKCVQVCGNFCNAQPGWDDADAVRAISLCKANYYADLAGVDLGYALTSYCNSWLARPNAFVTSPAYEYATRYQFDGTPCGEPATGYAANGLGSFMHFSFDRPSFAPRLDEAFRGHLDRDATPPRFDTGSSNCMGVYFPAFSIISFGTGIGRDRPAFLAPAPSNLVATATSASSVSLTWSPVAGAASYTIERATTASSFASIGSSPAPSFTDTSLPANTAFLYRVRVASAASNIDMATTTAFADAPLQPAVTSIRGVHVDELQTAVNAVRTAAGLTPVDGGRTAIVHATELITLRSALDEARQQLGFAPTSPCQPVTAGAIVRTCDVETLRAGVR
ncbi:MAG TPA: fibronectin type III domain-containing protein [Thermoanaerobaculia bacterium]|nr:fibronectin type III domain-containing protein [Thermoanaerobaculia bacterium]